MTACGLGRYKNTMRRRRDGLVPLWLSVLSAAFLLLNGRAASADEQPLDPKKLKPTYGLFGVGFHIEAGAGVYQVLGQGGISPGVYPRVALEAHLGPHLSLPVVARFQTTVAEGVPDFAQLSIAPGINVRLRELEWPFAIVFGAAVRIGKFTATKQLTDPSFQTTPDKGTQDAIGFPLAPEGTAKFEWWIAAPLVLKVSVTYAPIFVDKKAIHNLEEALAVALVF